MGCQEAYSVTEITRLCAQSEYLDETDIRIGDKGVSWDGNIVYYKNKKPKAVGKEMQIPIQIKGQKFAKLPRKDTISYKISMRDLDNYFYNGGVIYFLVAIEEKTFRVKAFAIILLPSDIKRIKAGKEQQKSITVSLKHIPSSKDLENLCVLFYTNKNKQSLTISGVPKMNYMDIEHFTFSAIKTEYKDPAIAIAKAPIKYLYAVKNGIEIPLAASKISTIYDGTIDISIGEKYNRQIPVKRIFSQDKTVISFMDVIKIIHDDSTGTTTLNYENILDSQLSDAYQVAELILAVYSGDTIQIDGEKVSRHVLNNIKKEFGGDFLTGSREIVRFKKILQELQIPSNMLTVSEIIESENDLLILRKLLIEAEPVEMISEHETGVYFYNIGKKNVLLEFEKNDNGETVLHNYFLQQHKHRVCDPISKKEINKWLVVHPRQLSTLLFDHSKMIEELSKIDNETDLAYLWNLVLEALNEYDKNQEKELLSLIEKLQKILEEKNPDAKETIINQMQIRYRKGKLNDGEREQLLRIKVSSDDVTASCCSCILLEQIEEFQMLFKKLSREDQELFMIWPISNLCPKDIRENL